MPDTLPPPIGRGYGFSYTNDAGRRNKDEDKGPKVAEMGSITGSDNDLRRLSIEACVSILLKFGVEQSVVDANMSRGGCDGCEHAQVEDGWASTLRM